MVANRRAVTLPTEYDVVLYDQDGGHRRASGWDSGA